MNYPKIVHPNNTFKVINENYAVDGVLCDEDLVELTEVYKSILYMCSDNGADVGYPGGFEALNGKFQNSYHFPIDVGSQTFNSSEVTHDKLDLIAASYRKMESALESLPKPVLISCKTSRRASMFITAYLGIIEKKCVEDSFEYAQKNEFLFLLSPGLKMWTEYAIRSAPSDLIKFSKTNLIFRQMKEKESDTYTYLLGDSKTNECILIDPVIETVERDVKYIQELGLNLTFCLNTHVHADHITGSGLLKSHFPNCKSVISAVSGADADIKLQDNEKVYFGQRYVIGISTPGHTAGCFSYILDDYSDVFTGDALLIRGCGRTDFQGGSSEDLYNSVHQRLFTLPDGCIVYPAHDYKGCSSSSIGEEKRFNPRLTKSKEDFVTLMAGLGLAYPKKIDVSLPANMKCGLF